MRRAPVLAIALLVVLTGCTSTALQPQSGTGTGIQFSEVSECTGLEYQTVRPMSMTEGGGVYVADYNNDGWPDILTVGAHPKDSGRPVLFTNTGGKFDRSGELPARLLANETVTGALFFDRDGDGWKDLLLLLRHDSPVYLENQQGDLQRKQVGFDRKLAVPMGAVAADFDRDGNLDVFVYQNGDWAETTPLGAQYKGVASTNGHRNLLYLSDGAGFAEPTPIGKPRWSLAASAVDLNGDGRPDIHVANDYGRDSVYLNQRNGSFERVSGGKATNRNGMSSEVRYVNDDRRPDIYVTNIYFDTENVSSEVTANFLEYTLKKRVKGNNLLINQGNGQFTDAAAEYGVRKGGWGWAATFADFDNDGDTELFHTTRSFSKAFVQVTFPSNATTSYYRYPALWQHTEDGFSSMNASHAGFEATNGRGVAALDYDRDGDRDLVVGAWAGSYRLYENTASPGDWLQVRLDGTAAQSSLGATVTVRTESGRTLRQVKTSEADFVSQESRVLHFGLGSSTVTQLTVHWPNGEKTTVEELPENARIAISPNGSVRTVEPADAPASPQACP